MADRGHRSLDGLGRGQGLKPRPTGSPWGSDGRTEKEVTERNPLNGRPVRSAAGVTRRHTAPRQGRRRGRLGAAFGSRPGIHLGGPPSAPSLARTDRSVDRGRRESGCVACRERCKTHRAICALRGKRGRPYLASCSWENGPGVRASTPSRTAAWARARPKSARVRRVPSRLMPKLTSDQCALIAPIGSRRAETRPFFRGPWRNQKTEAARGSAGADSDTLHRQPERQDPQPYKRGRAGE